MTGSHNSSSCLGLTGLTGEHSDTSIWLSSVHTPCKSNRCNRLGRLVRSRQFYATINLINKNNEFNEMTVVQWVQYPGRKHFNLLRYFFLKKLSKVILIKLTLILIASVATGKVDIAD